MQVIPAVDLLGGRCVRLLRGDFGKATEYSDDPLLVVRQLVIDGAERIHVVDLDAARDAPDNRAVVQEIVRQSEVAIEVAGGVRSEMEARQWFDVGASFVVVGTMAAENPEAAADLVRQRPDRVCVAIDMRGDTVSTHGWQRGAGESLDHLLGVLEDTPVERYIYTDINRDGTMQGPNFDGLSDLMGKTRHGVVLSGGVSSMDDVRRANALGATGVILGRALYERKLSLRDALAAAG